MGHAAEIVARLRSAPTDACVIWPGSLYKDGYGAAYVGANKRAAHRVVYEQIVGPIPAGLDLDHLCRTRACVNPAHLEPVTRKENLLRGQHSATGVDVWKFCVNGHEKSVRNTYRRPNGTAGCRACNAAAVARYRARRSA